MNQSNVIIFLFWSTADVINLAVRSCKVYFCMVPKFTENMPCGYLCFNLLELIGNKNRAFESDFELLYYVPNLFVLRQLNM